MSGRKRAEESEYVDTLTAFFQDVARLPIIGGRTEYLPLTRRIRRGVLLAQLRGDNPEHTCERITEALCQTLDELIVLCRGISCKRLDLQQLASEIEPFLDDPDQEVTPTLAKTFAALKACDEQKYVQAEELGWRCFYLLSLLPMPDREQFPARTFSAQIGEYLEAITAEAEISKQRLIEGTLRYSISIARSFLGRGIPYLDLVQEGFLGLIRATESYDERLGHFQHYAGNWIRQRILRHIADSCSMIRVPVHVHEKLTRIARAWHDFEERNGRAPREGELFEAANQISTASEEEYPDDLEEDDDNDEATERETHIETAVQKRRETAHKRLMDYYWMVTLPPYSLDSAEFTMSTIEEGEERRVAVELSDSLVDQSDSEQIVEQGSLREALLRILETTLNERERAVLRMRYGFYDGEEHTLEEVGQFLGVTRERIRQIEANALRKIGSKTKYNLLPELKEFLNADHSPSVLSIADQQRRQLLEAIAQYEELHPIEDTAAVAQEIAHIEHLMEKYVEGRRRRVWDTRRHGSRGALLQEVLEDLGKPTHYSVIHAKAMERVPEELRFSRERAYGTLFYGDAFRSYGKGVFGLASWGTTLVSDLGETILQHCPMPLLPANMYPNAFFDSVMLGRDLLSKYPLTARQFWLEMQGRFQGSSASVRDAQDAFDAWYAAGLVDRIDFVQQRDEQLTLTLSTGASLPEVRQYCLNLLCRRILKMSELLLVLDRVARPTVPIIQRVLFGSEKAGFDVPTRLTLLASFGAVQQVGDEWRLTDIGRAALEANPPSELPDLGEAEAAGEDDDATQIEWNYEDLGLLDL